MNKDYLLALDLFEEEKGIPREAIIDTLEKALVKSYEKNYDNNENVKVEIDRENGDIKVYSLKEVVEEVEDPILEISLSEAKKINNLYELGDEVPIEVTPKNFGRIAAQTARNIVIQKIKDFEREAIYEEFIDRDKELINGTIQRIDNGNVFIDLGKTEGIIPISEQVKGETYTPNKRMKFFIKEVKNTGKGAQVVLSRASKDLITRLFEIEVPEISDGIVEIYSIAREAGSRTKIAVFTNDEDIDPIGACVGFKGIRVKNIVDELNGEKIDIIIYSKDNKEFIANSLSPSEVIEVITRDEDKTALVVVPDDQLSLSIGKEGQNVRLAAKLTNWKIDIIGQEEYEKRLEEGSLEDLFEKELNPEDVLEENIEDEEITEDDELDLDEKEDIKEDLLVAQDVGKDQGLEVKDEEDEIQLEKDTLELEEDETSDELMEEDSLDSYISDQDID